MAVELPVRNKPIQKKTMTSSDHYPLSIMSRLSRQLQRDADHCRHDDVLNGCPKDHGLAFRQRPW